jgi:hypothetical protein
LINIIICIGIGKCVGHLEELISQVGGVLGGIQVEIQAIGVAVVLNGLTRITRRVYFLLYLVI